MRNWKRTLAWFTKTHVSERQLERAPDECANPKKGTQLLFQVEDVWNDNRTTATHLHGEIHLRLSVKRAASAGFLVEQAIETSDRALLLLPELTSSELAELLFNEVRAFPTWNETCHWVRFSDFLTQARLRVLYEKALISYLSNELPPSRTLTPWSDRESGELFEIELPKKAEDQLHMLLNGLSAPAWEFPRSLNDLRYLLTVDVNRCLEQFGVSRNSVRERANNCLIPLVETRFMDILSGKQ